MKTLLFPILSIIAAIGLYFFFISPQLVVIDELKQKDEQFTQSLSDVREIDGIIGRLSSTYASITREDLEKLERFLPREFDRTRAVRDLSAIISRDEVEIASINIEDSRSNNNNNDGPSLKEHEITINFFASYNNFKDILQSIEKSIQIAHIDSVKFRPPQGESEDSLGLGLYAYTMSLTYYSFNNTEE